MSAQCCKTCKCLPIRHRFYAHLVLVQLDFTRGTVIPLSLYLRSLDPSTLTSLASPQSILIVLQQSVHYSLGDRPALGTTRGMLDADGRGVKRTNVAQAVWRLQSEDEGTSSRVLEGEIHLPKHLPPSCEIKQFAVYVRCPQLFSC